jgi:hypothetical protein
MDLHCQSLITVRFACYYLPRKLPTTPASIHTYEPQAMSNKSRLTRKAQMLGFLDDKKRSPLAIPFIFYSGKNLLMIISCSFLNTCWLQEQIPATPRGTNRRRIVPPIVGLLLHLREQEGISRSLISG